MIGRTEQLQEITKRGGFASLAETVREALSVYRALQINAAEGGFTKVGLTNENGEEITVRVKL